MDELIGAQQLAAYTEMLEHERMHKDDYFRRGADSPILHKERPSFAGLRYFPADPNLRFNLPLTPFAEQAEVILTATQGDERPFLRYGTVNFSVEGQECQLTIDQDTQVGAFFLPFRDATSGQESYGGGRYLDVEQTEDESLTLDFNLAYNPWCNYNDLYSCVLPPAENRLAAPIRAGEMTYGEAH